MSWRDQLRLGWRFIRWVWWPEGYAWWMAVTVWTATAAASIGIARGTLWPLAGALVLSIAVGVVRHRQGRRRS